MEINPNNFTLKNGHSATERNTSSNSSNLDYISSSNPMDNGKLLEICSRRRSNSLLNHQLLMDSSNSPYNFTSTSLNHSFHLSPSLSTPHCATSFSPLPRFPPPATVQKEQFHSNLETTCILQPRVNPVSRRSRHFVPNERKDEYYWQKRKKNNEAARKSREKRRTIDSVLEEKVLILTHENKLLRQELNDLKMKYGELEKEKSTDVNEVSQAMKVQQSDPNQTNGFTPPVEAPPRPCSCSCSRSSSSPSAKSPSTTITLPKVNVVLESEKLTGDNASSAKLVLSNLASGTLILAPVNLISKIQNSDEAKLVTVDDAKSHGAALVLNSAAKFEDLKEVEAANTLASLFRASDEIAGDGSRTVQQQSSNNTSVCESCQQSRKEIKKSQNLPCKLRFKSSQSITNSEIH